MARRAALSDTLMGRVRVWFGLTQAELALYLNLSPTLVRGIETGRRALTSAVLASLSPLAMHLPDDALAAPTAADDVLPPADAADTPDAAELDFRRRVCLAQAARLAAELEQLTQQAQMVHRWERALPALLLATPPLSPGDDVADAAIREQWRRGWLHRRARPLPPETATRAALLRAKMAGLQAEAAALASAASEHPKAQAAFRAPTHD